MQGRNGPVARTHSVAEMGVPCGVVSRHSSSGGIDLAADAMTLRGIGLLAHHRVGRRPRQHGGRAPIGARTPNVLADGRMGNSAGRLMFRPLIESWATHSGTSWD